MQGQGDCGPVGLLLPLTPHGCKETKGPSALCFQWPPFSKAFLQREPLIFFSFLLLPKGLNIQMRQMALCVTGLYCSTLTPQTLTPVVPHFGHVSHYSTKKSAAFGVGWGCKGGAGGDLKASVYLQALCRQSPVRGKGRDGDTYTQQYAHYMTLTEWPRL